MRQVFGDEAFYSSDIGCYTLGYLPPYKAADFLFCMGSSVSARLSGFAKASGKTVVAFIGDSTFFHSGGTGLINAVFNNHDILLVILDNTTTAMTGHQPHPGVEARPPWDPTPWPGGHRAPGARPAGSSIVVRGQSPEPQGLPQGPGRR